MASVWAKMRMIEKADTFRYAVLYDIGGLYADIDVECKKPIDQWNSRHSNDYGVDLMVGLEVATERPDWAQWFAHRYQVCQWTMAGRKGHPVFASVLEKIKVFFESHTKEERSKITVLKSTGPGPWSDAVHEFFATYGVTYGDSSDGAVKIPEEQAREQLVHIGTALVLPVRALATNSGGYTHHKPDDVFALHHFAGEWKADKDAGLDLGAEPVRG